MKHKPLTIATTTLKEILPAGSKVTLNTSREGFIEILNARDHTRIINIESPRIRFSNNREQTEIQIEGYCADGGRSSYRPVFFTFSI